MSWRRSALGFSIERLSANSSNSAGVLRFNSWRFMGLNAGLSAFGDIRWVIFADVQGIGTRRLGRGAEDFGSDRPGLPTMRPIAYRRLNPNPDPNVPVA